MVKDYLLTTDNFLNPRVLKGTDAIGQLLLRLLLMTPGTNPLHPLMGVGVGSKYQFITENDLNILQTDIEEQISIYLPSEFSAAKVNLSIGADKTLSISIIIQEIEFVFDTRETNNPVSLSNMLP